MPCHLPPSPDFSNNSSDFYLPPPQQPCIMSYFCCLIFRCSFRPFFSVNFLFTVYCTRLDALGRFFILFIFMNSSHWLRVFPRLALRSPFLREKKNFDRNERKQRMRSVRWVAGRWCVKLYACYCTPNGQNYLRFGHSHMLEHSIERMVNCRWARSL